MNAPLAGVTVIEVDSWMAAPSAGAILADMGARVIKVEPPAGDPMRDMSRPPKLDEEGARRDYDYQFDVDNRGKESIVVALDTSEGQDVMHRLVAGAECFLCNLLPQRQEKFQLDSNSLLGVKADLVHATLTGYGTTGPDAWRPGYDVTAFFGRSGLYDASREGDDGIVPMARPAQGDHTTGLALVAAILAALRLAEKTGEGQVVETSLYETAVWTQASDYAVTAVDAAPVRRRARHQQLSATANRYPCGDGKWVVFNMPEPRHWPGFATALGREDWIEDERFATPRDRYRNMDELVAGVDEALAARSRDEWGAIFDEAGLIWGPVLGLHEVATDGQADAIGLFPEVPHPELGSYRTVRIPMRFHSADVGPRGPAPAKGQHTEAVLAELEGKNGLNPEQPLAPVFAGLEPGPWPFEIVFSLDSWSGLLDGVIYTDDESEGACALLRCVSWSGPNLVRRTYVMAGLPDSAVALFRRNVDRGSCDVNRLRAETEALVALAGPAIHLLGLDVGERVITSSVRTLESQPPDLTLPARERLASLGERFA